ncbi:hypothetical protein Tco_0366714 [Tanacetum coccineum]
MCTYLKNMEGYKLNDLKLKDFDSIQEMFDRAFKRVNTFEDFRTELVEGKEKRARSRAGEVAIDAIPLAVKSPSIVDWKIHKEGRKSYYQIIRADGKSQCRHVLHIQMRHFKTLSLDELRSPDFNLLSDQEYSEEEEAEAMAETMEQYMSKTRTDYGSGVARPKIDNKNQIELKGQFLKEL